ncbi:rhomboid family intramembrane serine protease [uncultured Jannaschia sp.]|uniref:rhomboid family intramembrane serine protease n=1 Tax=uncultured Jannaschia sp. TaxID=293347 RepID=UPI002613DC1C|nr:rhomboid family intramembrane serine protease [uncultured Jannaschia sp.]
MAPLRPAAHGLIGLILLCTLIEVTLSLADLGVLGMPRLRQLTYDYAGFWPGLLGNWRPNYAVQPWTMFLTYGFLHGGPVHLIVNMITLWSLGRAVIDRVGGRGFWLLYGAAILGGGAGFGLLASDLRPMVGASGALFGLVGGILAWTYVDRYSLEEAMWPVIRAVLLLVALNVVFWWAMDGQLAWETHLGGFVAGWIMALLIDPRPLGGEPAPLSKPRD